MPISSKVFGRRKFLVFGAVGTGVAATVALGVSAAASVEEFDEMYRGRRIHGGRQAFIDDDLLHTMDNADGTCTTSVNHYESFSSRRDAARRAVDTLGDLRPESPLSPHRHGH